jgi:hypothetical protein
MLLPFSLASIKLLQGRWKYIAITNTLLIIISLLLVKSMAVLLLCSFRWLWLPLFFLQDGKKGSSVRSGISFRKLS